MKAFTVCLLKSLVIAGRLFYWCILPVYREAWFSDPG